MSRQTLITPRLRVVIAIGLGLVLASFVAFTLRWHTSPRIDPFLSQAHLSGLITDQADGVRILFIGNSMVMRHDLAAKVAAVAGENGVRVETAVAAAEGARLIETIRVPGIRTVIEDGDWDAIVVQDFTKTPLRLPDRLGSRFAIWRISRWAGETPIVLFPPWPARADNAVYDRPGFLTRRPDDPLDFASVTMAHYLSVGNQLGLHVVPVPLAWHGMKDHAPALYAEDGHHASAEGAMLTADVLWAGLADRVAQ